MSGKYREILTQDVAPKSALKALERKVAKQGVLVGTLHQAKIEAADAAAARPDGELYVTRDELLYALETGEAPEHWAPAPADETGAAE